MVHLNDEFDIQLKETDQRFQKTYGNGIVGRDIETILTEDTTFNDYIDSLTEAFDPELKESLESMMENTRSEILQESSMGQIQPFASLTMPMLVKLWARLVMTQAIPTEPVNTPVFTVRWVKPYIMGHDGSKYYLPETINGMPDDNPEITGMRQFIPVIENDKTGASLFKDGRLSKYDLYTGLDDLNVDRSKEDAVDRRFFIVGAKWSDAIGTRKKADGTVDAADKGWVDFKTSQIIRLDTSNNLRGSVEYVQDDGTGAPAAVAAEDTIQGFVDTARGYLTVMSVSGKLEAIKIRGYVSSEQHTFATQGVRIFAETHAA